MKINTKEPTEEEIAANLAQGRKDTLEGEVFTLIELKKNLQTGMDEIVKKTEEGEIKIKENIIELEKVQTKIAEAEKSLTKNTKTLEEVKTKTEEVEKSHADFMANAVIEKESITTEISGLISSREKEKQTTKDEIQALEESKAPLTEEAEALAKNIEILKQKELDQIETNNKLEEENIALVKEKQTFYLNLDKLNETVSIQDTIIENGKTEIKKIEEAITLKKEEEKNVDSKIEKKNAEYAELEKSAFAILTKNDLLDQRETFLRSQYERAGINWE